MESQQSNDARFKPGQSGNPTGRPKGSRNKISAALDLLCEGEAEAIVKSMIDKAKDGDAMAARAILDRIYPARKGSRIQFTLPPLEKPDQLPSAIAEITQQVADGEISPDEGALIVQLIEAQRKAIETSDLAARMAAIEERLARQ